MKKTFLTLTLALAALTLAGCGGNEDPNPNPNPNPDPQPGPTVTVTENTDPVTFESEKLTATEWAGAFKAQTNYSLKTVVTIPAAQTATPTAETEGTEQTVATITYKFDGDKIAFAMTTTGEGAMQGEGYIVKNGELYTIYTRSKTDADWSEWDSEDYAKESYDGFMGQVGNLAFAATKYTDFSYSDADKGYAILPAGLTSMKEQLCTFITPILEQSPADDTPCNLTKFVLKLNGGKPAAVVANVAQTEEEPEETSSKASEETPEEAPEITITQIYYAYGTTKVNLPANLPESSETPEK